MRIRIFLPENARSLNHIAEREQSFGPCPGFKAAIGFTQSFSGEMNPPFQYPSRAFLSSRFCPIQGKPKMCVCIACPFLLLKLKSPRSITSENGARNLRRQFRRHCLIARQPCTRHTRRLLASDPVLPRLPTKSSDVMAGCISYSGASATDLHRLPFLVCINQDFFI